MNALVSLETESRENIAMNIITRDGIMNGFKTGASLQFDVLKQGYNTAVKRIAYFIRKIDRFQDFTLEDKRSLIGRYRKLLIDIQGLTTKLRKSLFNYVYFYQMEIFPLLLSLVLSAAQCSQVIWNLICLYHVIKRYLIIVLTTNNFINYNTTSRV